MAAAIAWGSGTTFTVPGNFLNNSTALLWIWYGGGGGGNGVYAAAGRGGNGGNIYLIDPINLTVGGQYGVGVGGNAGSGAGGNQSSFYVWPQQGYNGANPGGAGGAIDGGGGGAANPGGGGGNGGTAGPPYAGVFGGAAGPGSAPWPSYGGAGGQGSGGGAPNNGSNGNAYGGGGGAGSYSSPGTTSYGGVGLQGIVYLWYNTVTPATISSVSPTSTMYQNNGVPIYFFGSMYNTVYAVNIEDLYTGGVYGCGFTIQSDGQMLVYPPALPQHPAYNPYVFIYNQAGEASFSNVFTVYPNIPICSSVTGPSYDNGSNEVDLNGEFFTTLNLVQIDGVGGMNYTTTPNGPSQWWFGNDSIIGMYLPAIAPQYAQYFTLRVGNPSGQAVISLEYIPTPPTFTGITASTGDESGGYSVTITGGSFTTTQSVYFGSAICPSFTVNSDSSITVVVPAFNGASTFNGGQVNITLYNQTAGVAGFDFTYTFAGYPALNVAHAFA